MPCTTTCIYLHKKPVIIFPFSNHQHTKLRKATSISWGYLHEENNDNFAIYTLAVDIAGKLQTFSEIFV
jgi:hypothetical protein